MRVIRQRSYEEIRQSMRNNINDRDETVDSKAGTFVSDVFVCPTSDELAAFYADMKLMELNQSILTATAEDLDRLCKNYFTFRIGATKATGSVRFYIYGTNRTTLDVNRLPAEVYIPPGYLVGTTETSVAHQVLFTTVESAYVTRNQIMNSLPFDEAVGYRYVEVDVEAYAVGENGNVDANAVNQMTSTPINGVALVRNSLAMTGGSDQEDDMSLRARVMLSILGASICTKNGYKKFIITKNHVEDVLVCGGGDENMFRDGGYIDAAGKYQYGRGGMVDIWVRGKQVATVTKTFTVKPAYITNGAEDIELDYQPVLRISSIRSVASGVVYENAADYEVEYGTTQAGVATMTYYRDVLWDFSVTNTFPDTAMYSLDVVDYTEIEMLKRQVDEELVKAIDYLYNVNYSINWGMVTYEDISAQRTRPLFQKVYYNGKPIKLIAVDARLNGRTYVKYKNRIYLRCYRQPDYVLAKTTYADERYESRLGDDIGNSVLAHDAVHWINPKVLQEGDNIEITYSYNILTVILQQQMNAMNILTADVLIRQAYEVPIQVMMTVQCDTTTTSVAIRNVITTKITRYVNSIKQMGQAIEESELAAIARTTPGVTFVDLDSVSLSKKNTIAAPRIVLAQNEYFVLDNVDITVEAEASYGGD